MNNSYNQGVKMTETEFSRLLLDAMRYRWLRKEFAAGRETYLAEGLTIEEDLDNYIDRKAINETHKQI
jgi:hypothetical protein